LDLDPKVRTRRRVLRFFVPLCVALVAVAALSAAIAGQLRSRTAVDRLLERGAEGIAGIGLPMTWGMTTAVGDLEILARHEAVATLPETPDEATIDRIGQVLLAVSDARETYAQVRWIDATGQEQVRVERADGASVCVADLQNKAHRYYFREASELAQGQTWVSPLDLNVERGEVEAPWVPMIRLARPVVTASGERRGVFVLNYRVGPVLDRFRLAGGHLVQSAHLVDDRGHWLVAPSADDEWGFMFERDDRTLAGHDADAWAAMQARPIGQVQTGEGAYTWRRIDALDPSSMTDASLVTSDGRDIRWTAYSFVARAELAAVARSAWVEVLGFVGLALLVGLLVAALAAWALARRWLARAALREADFVFRSAADGILVFGADRRVRSVNPAWASTVGMGRADVIGRAASDVFDATEPETLASMWDLLARDGAFSGRLAAQSGDGAVVPLQVSMSRIADDDGSNERYVCVTHDASALVAREAVLERLASRDALTGLPNRAAFAETVRRDLDRAAEAGVNVAVLFVDLDGFKAVNDALGHAAGDDVLVAVAERIEDTTRSTDTAARLGGDEFVVSCFDVASPDAVRRVARRIVDRVVGDIPTRSGSASVGASVGVAWTSRPDRATVDRLLEAADAAMYRAKAGEPGSDIVIARCCDGGGGSTVGAQQSAAE